MWRQQHHIAGTTYPFPSTIEKTITRKIHIISIRFTKPHPIQIRIKNTIFDAVKKDKIFAPFFAMGSGSSVDKNAPDLVSKELCSTAIQGHQLTIGQRIHYTRFFEHHEVDDIWGESSIGRNTWIFVRINVKMRLFGKSTMCTIYFLLHMLGESPLRLLL